MSGTLSENKSEPGVVRALTKEVDMSLIRGILSSKDASMSIALNVGKLDERLDGFKEMIEEDREKIGAACKKDLGVGFDPEPVFDEIKKAKDLLHLLPCQEKLSSSTFGVVLIMPAKDCPLEQVLKVVVGAIATGNSVVFRPNKSYPNVCESLMDMFRHINSSSMYFFAVFRGEIKPLLKLDFDRVVYVEKQGMLSKSEVVKMVAKKTPILEDFGLMSAQMLATNPDVKIPEWDVAILESNNIERMKKQLGVVLEDIESDIAEKKWNRTITKMRENDGKAMNREAGLMNSVKSAWLNRVNKPVG
jgi:hypothetical protein